jgi:diaminopimelate decarboxylase
MRNNLASSNKDHLMLHGVDLVELCDKYGTPLFVFDEVNFIDNFTRFCQAFESVYPNVMVCYSVKTNGNLAVCQILREKGAYAEVASELDLYVALKAGFRGDKIIFDGPFKPREALKRAIDAEVLLINVESFTEMERVNSVAGAMGIKQAVGIRINPFKDPGLSKYTNRTYLANAAYCNLESRFGFSVKEAYIVFKRIMGLKNVRLEGIMTHPYRAATKVLLPIVRELREKFGAEIRYLNIGGGFDSGDVRFVGSGDLVSDFLRRKIGLKSKLAEGKKVSNIESVAKSIIGEIKQSLGDSPEYTIIVEPGRFIASSSGILLARVDHVKNAGGYKWAVVDAGTNLLPRFAAIELRKIVTANKASRQPEEEVNIVGPLLFNEDFITLKAPLPKVSEGDILSIFNCGAYTLSRSNQFLHPRPAAVLINSKGEVKVIREKETFEDFLYKDRVV